MEDWYEQTRSYALRLTRFFSQTDTQGETDFGAYLKDLLAEIPYYKENPGDLRLVQTLSDPIERFVLFALVRGRGAQTIIFTGHYDVVGIENYGELEEWACDPESLLPKLISLLKKEDQISPGLSPNDRLALDDLTSGQFLPGRGLLDMKCGLAAGISVLQRFSQLPVGERPVSLLFIAVPDEEIASNGARTAGALLPDLAREWNLDFTAAINLDASDDHGDGSRGQTVYLGSVGKLLPSVYLVGRETHAGSPFSGINANLLAAELTRRIECNPELGDSLEGMYAAPPTCLKQADTKTHYDVTTPTHTWCYYNWLTLQHPVGSVLEKMCGLVKEALGAAMISIQASARQFSLLSNQPIIIPDWIPQVYTFSEVKELALQRAGPGFEDQLEILEQQLASDPALDTPTCCLRLTETVWSASGLSGPAAVVAFSAIFYPPVTIQNVPGRAARLLQTVTRVAEDLSREKNTPITLQPFFPGISDISFFGGRVSPVETKILAANTPAWKHRTGFDYSGISRLGIPAVNIGPWGRDYHQRIERVQMPYSFEILPEFLWKIALQYLSA